MVKELGKIGMSTALRDLHDEARPALARKPIIGFMVNALHYKGITKQLDKEEIPLQG